MANFPIFDNTKDPELLGLDYDDPIERVCIDIVQMNRRKRADYAQDGNIFSNFEQAAFAAGTTVEQGIEYMIATKQARLVALRSNGRPPQNESVYDTMLDRAVYSMIALAYQHHLNETTVKEVDPRGEAWR